MLSLECGLSMSVTVVVRVKSYIWRRVFCSVNGVIAPTTTLGREGPRLRLQKGWWGTVSNLSAKDRVDNS